ncbi:hypothetical protein LL037_05085 [Clostridium estertheticum]|uniref:hypothetical protein n=1 Tax=Clostridium estertheticum TaxID=238834 RepID=UPI001C0C3CBA|nr:hypothetical protein [Clostridium estertheticum]MBU3202360.1 hypothetical protein [Clostridium estertheticum]WAG66522.1 hypothetical protein LL037_05085 [Clostridium estertheticum]
MGCLKTRKCVKKDLVTEVQDRVDTIDAIIVGSSVYYGGAVGQLIACLSVCDSEVCRRYPLKRESIITIKRY